MTKQRMTEASNVKSIMIDEMSSIDILSLMNEEDHQALHAVKKALPIIAQAVDSIVERWKKGGRCFVVGAGTSGRLGVVDAVELIPTYSIEEDQWIGIIAGGMEAMWTPLEENEDDIQEIIKILDNYSISSLDTVIGVTASGSTPFVLSAIEHAKKIDALTISISCNENADATEKSDFGIELPTGAEVIRGSTRLKAGTAQKMVLNMLSTATMIRLGKVYQNEMVDMKLINKKLVQRAVKSLMNITGISENEAKIVLQSSNYHLKSAIFMVLTGGTSEVASHSLQKTRGHLKKAIQHYIQTNH
ncbi:N-acetylmuramic acid 6-phosphate etherase [Bacillus sp. 03113]|uniref:N-acetylmuramic acid 6-phosphate etherase n=1 Tax=Bacillus sp. 03113 TaxID=2578211 RepID=UPI001141C80F|nr:N-acetylmuramic acid 6-phosphate etherase [Bacillus sp. 03113]